MAYLDPKEAFEHLQKRVLEGIQEQFARNPIVGKTQSLHLEGLEVKDTLHPDDIRAQQKAKTEGDTWAVPVYATVALKENDTGKVIDRRKIRIAEIPKTTSRYSYIIDGQEYQVDNQWQLQPGVYTRRKANGELVSKFNAGRQFDVVLDPASKIFQMKYGKSRGNLPIYPLLKTLGVSDEELTKSWGKEILDANKAAPNSNNVLERFYKADKPYATTVPTREVAAEHFYDAMEKAKLRPESTQITLGKPFTHVTGDTLKLATEKMLKVQSGHPEDDRDSLVFKDLRSAGDFAHDAIHNAGMNIKQRATRQIGKAKDVWDVLKFDMFNNPIKKSLSSGNAAARTATQINPLEMVSSAQQTTIMGSGGIQSERAVSAEAKFVNPSHLGFLDPLNTPEGCFDSATEVFTARGWVPWSLVTPIDRLACNVDDRLVFEHPLALLAIPFDGELYGVDTTRAKQRGSKPLKYLVTPGHRVWSRPIEGAGYRIDRADEMHGKKRVFQVGHKASAGALLRVFDLPFVAGNNSSKNVGAIDLGDWAELLGWFLAEGNVQFDEAASSYKVKLLQSDLPGTDGCARIERLLDRLPFSWSKFERENRRMVYSLCTKQLAHYMLQFGGSFEKFVPECVFDWPSYARVRLLEALMAGDGRTVQHRGSNTWANEIYTTTSPALAIGVERLCISLGSAAKIHSYKDLREERYHDVYEVRIYQGGERHIQKDLLGAYYKQSYSGTVYCAEVPGGLVYVRREGSIGVWSGNSRTGITLRLPVGVRQVGHEVKIPLYNLLSKKTELVTPGALLESNVVLPDQVRWDGDTPHPLHKLVRASAKGNEIRDVPFEDAHYVLKHPSQLFNMTSNLIPFLGNTSGNRASMASRHMEQAVSLKHREAPLVQVDGPNSISTFEKLMGAKASHESPVDGKVVDIKKDAIFIEDHAGTKHEVQIYNNYKLNDAKSVMHSTPIVAVGDHVKKEQTIADTNFSKNGTLALGTNLRVAYLPFKGYNFEDGVVISESAAKKLSSEHLQQLSLPMDADLVLSKQRFHMSHPGLVHKAQYDKLDSDGVIRVGQKVQPGDPLVVAMKPFKLKDRTGLSAIRRSMSGEHTDKSLRWDSDFDGEVVSVHKGDKGLSVHVRTVEPMQVGDKTSNRFGGKGIVTMILPDREMPHTKDGKHIEVALNPSGVPGRMNVGQLFETAAGKIAEKTGKPYIVKNFDTNVDSLAKVKADLKTHGLTDTEELRDPGTGQSLGQVMVGPQHMFKLVHQVEKKLSVRSGSGSLPGGASEHYDLNLQPAGGSDTGGQSMGTLGLFALLAHGAKANIREMQSYKSEGPDPQTDPAKKWPSDHHRIWAAIQTGHPLPPPKPSFAFRKFEDMLRGAGVNIDKRGHDLVLSPMTNAQILTLAPKALPHPADMLDYKTDKNGDPKPRPGGLWDEHLTGGLGGRRWTRIALAEPLPNPMFEGPVRALTGLSAKDFADILHGAKGVSAGGHIMAPDTGTTGGAGIKLLLDRVDVAKELPKAEAQLKAVKGQGVDKALKKVKYLRALKQINTSPSDAYILHNIPVLPPIMRPVSSLPDNRVRFDDVNQLYSDFAKINDKLKDPTLVRNLTDEGKSDLRKDYYDGVKAFMGIGNRYESAAHKGLLHQISGKTPKEGFFQSRLTSRKQDLAMRSTIVPEPALDLDEVGLPRHAALELFKPFVVRKLRDMGAIADEMQGASFIEKKSPQVWRALDKVMAERPILLKRDPALHKYSVQAFKAKPVAGNAIQIHPLVTGGFTADFDGDQQIGAVIVFISNAALHRGLASGVELWKTTAWWESRALGEVMSARFYSMIPCLKDGALYLLDLSEVPHAEEHCTQGHIDFHPVPKGVEVLAYDERTGAVVPAGVSGWSFHRQRAVEFVTLASGRQIITDDDERGVYGLNAELNLVRSRPSASVGMFVPTMHTLSLDESYARIALPVQDDARLKSHVELDGRTGRLLGTIVGDGWAAFANGKLKGQVVVAAEEGSVAVGFTQDLQAFFTEIPTVTPNERIGGDFGPEVVSRRYTVSSMAWSTLVSEWVGHMAENKHLPPFWSKTPRSFRIGLLAGYFDTDGSISISNGKAKKQWMLNSSTRSIRLANELRLLSASIGIKATITPSETPGGKSFWVVNYSIVDFHKLQEFPVSHADKRALFANFFSEDAPEEKNSYSQTDLVPMPKLLAKAMLRIVGTRYGASVYQRVYVSQSCGYMTRYTARHLVQLVSGYLSEDALFNRWAELVEQGHVRWDRVESFQATGVLEDGYDLTVPGYETFMSADGVILSNTMSAYVPITHEAVAEAHKMMPSNNLFSEATGKLMYQPSLESALGLYKLSVVGKDSHKKFEHPGQALDAVRSGDLHYTDTVHIGSKKTTPGRILLASAVPEGMQEETLHDLSYRINGKGLSTLLTGIAKHYTPQYGETVNKLKDLGNGASFGAAAIPRSSTAGHSMKFSMLDKTPVAVHDSKKDVFIPTGAHTLSLDDFTPDTAVRDHVLAAAHKAVASIYANSKLSKGEQDRQAISVYEGAGTEMKEQHEKKQDKDPSNLFTMYRAGVKPGWDQYKQMVLAPMIYKDSADKKLPTPVTKSYSEGLDVGSYWTQMHGARRGSVMKVQEVSGPGYLSKLLMSNMMHVLVNSDDCGTDKGVLLDVNEPDVHDRYLQQGFTHGQLSIPAGTVLTPDLVSKIRAARKDAKLLVRSPLKCEDEQGICQKCAGMNSSGQHFDMGHNIGVQSAQAVGERGVQLALKSFHTGGTSEQGGGSKLLSAFERFDQLVKLPEKVPNESTLAMKSGRVEKIIPTATGVDIYIGDRRHHIGKDANGIALHHNLPNVNTSAESFVPWKPPVVGMHFDAGETLSDPNRTTLNPHHLYEATGSIEKVQNHLTNEIHNLFKEEGIKRRSVETVVRAMSNLTKVVDPGDHPDVLRGEFKPMATIYKMNQELLRDKKAPIEHEPVMKGVNAMPLALQEDWMAKLQHERLRGTLMEAAAMGGVSHLHGTHPIPSVAYGAEMGLTSKDSLKPGYEHLRDVPAHHY